MMRTREWIGKIPFATNPTRWKSRKEYMVEGLDLILPNPNKSNAKPVRLLHNNSRWSAKFIL